MGEKEERQSEVREREESGREGGEGMKWEVYRKEKDKEGRERERRRDKRRGLRAHINNITCSSCCVWTVRRAVRETEST